ncbi:MAG: hypothetical protein FWH14_07420 [Oscillospiraceae bacterium]|nr:hypothetical protein [Oscillospiraceae bacterium]
MQAYEGYFENGQFYTSGQMIRIPEQRRVYITILDDSAAQNENAQAWHEFLTEIKSIDNENLSEFERVRFREVKQHEYA